jgi:iron complex outermembrane receptor protein
MARFRVWGQAVAAVSLILLGSGPSPAQEEEFFLFGEEELIEVAAKRAVRVEEAPGTVIVISREELVQTGALTLGEALAHIVSTEFSPETFTPGLTFRGVPSQFNNKILLMVDGRIVNSIYRGNFFLSFAQPLDSIKRVEIIRGPGSSLYGANAFAGVLNVVTQKGEDLQGGVVESVGGQDNTGLIHVAAGSYDEAAKRDLSVRVRGYYTDGYDAVNPDSPNVRHGDYHADIRWSQGGNFVALGTHIFRSGWPGTPELAFPGNSMEERQFYLDGSASWNFEEKGRFSFRAYGDYRDNVYDIAAQDWFGVTDPLCGGANCVEEIDFSTWTPTNANATCRDESGDVIRGCLCRDPITGASVECVDGHIYVWDVGLPKVQDPSFAAQTVQQISQEAFTVGELMFEWDFSEKTYFLAGVNHKWDSMRNSGIGHHIRSNYALFVQNEWRPTKKWILLAGTRYDYNSIYRSFVSPRANVVFLPGKHFILKSGFGRAFRAPTFLELFDDSKFRTASSQGNPDLEPEKIDTIELQGQFRWGQERQGRLTTTLFRYDIEDEISFDVQFKNLYWFSWGSWQGTNPGNYPVDCYDFNFSGCLYKIDTIPLAGTYQNIAERVGQGAEVEWLVPFAKHLKLGGNWSRYSIEAPPLDAPTAPEEKHYYERASAFLVAAYQQQAHFGLWVRFLGEQGESLISEHHMFGYLSGGVRVKNFVFSAQIHNVFQNAPIPDDAMSTYWHPRRDLRAMVSYRKGL